jgi:putative spermidine/putrescine transport system ATP-binding protein
MAREIRLLQLGRGITTIMVTHDQTEAMALADRLVLMHDGKVQQIGSPEALHLRPDNPFVARFIGGSNIVRGRIDAGTRLIPDDGPPITLAGAYRDNGVASLAVRPDSIRLGAPCINGARATVEHVVRLSPGLAILVRGPGLGPDAAPRHPAGTRVTLHWSRDDEFVFDAADRPAPAFSPERETNHA